MAKDTRTPIQREDDMHASLLAVLAQIAKNTGSIAQHAEVGQVAEFGEPKPRLAKSEGQKVEILFNGCRRVVLVDGHRIQKALTIETPRDQGSLAGVVKVSFLASEIVEREVSQEQFDALLSGG